MSFSLPGTMSFKRHVELGRVCLINYGELEGKLCTIVDVIDNNRVLVDGPAPVTGVKRQAINLKRIQLTDIKVPAKVNISQKCVPLRCSLNAVAARRSRPCTRGCCVPVAAPPRFNGSARTLS